MRNERHAKGNGYFLFGAIVLAIMGLSMAITATGTARFAVAMGYRAEVGYGVGVVFDLAKGLLPIALVTLLARRAFLFFVIIGFAWLGLLTYSALATEATVTTAIAAIERNGSWKAEARSGTRAELAAVEKRLDVLSQPAPPRPTKSLIEALAVEKVPPGVWRDSQECQSIRDSRYFQSACTKVLNLRRELAAAKDYEQLDAQASNLRQALAQMPLVQCPIRSPRRSFRCHSWPSPPARRPRRRFSPPHVRHRNHELLRAAALRALGGRGTREAQSAQSRLHIGGDRGIARDLDRATEKLPQGPSRIIPGSSLTAANGGISSDRHPVRDERAEGPSNIISLYRLQEAGRGLNVSNVRGGILGTIGNHVPEFVRQSFSPLLEHPSGLQNSGPPTRRGARTTIMGRCLSRGWAWN